MKKEDSVVLGEISRPVESVGIYIPSGTAPLISSVYMTVIPAMMAGVKNIYLTTPPNKYQSVDPNILVVADLLKVSGVYKIGGAQAVAAFAFGTKTVPKVQKIVGPGNIYVTEAKRQVYGYVDIDMMAGPSEVAVIANRYSNPKYVIADLEAQREHFMGLSILVTNSKKFAKTIKKEVKDGYIVLVKNLNEACEAVNALAPEHLEILIANPRRLLNKIDNAGAIFLGPYSPTAVGDYVAGPSHVLPTAGTAKFSSGLGVNDFMKSSHVIQYSKKGLEKVKDTVDTLCGIEGMIKHSNSVKARFE
jgi:histidinol dehydrogenase